MTLPSKKKRGQSLPFMEHTLLHFGKEFQKQSKPLIYCLSIKTYKKINTDAEKHWHIWKLEIFPPQRFLGLLVVTLHANGLNATSAETGA